MNPGKLDKRISFYMKSDEANENGFYDPDVETKIKTTWANIRSLKGLEFVQAMSIQEQNVKVFRCRYFKMLEEEDTRGTKLYIKYKNRIYNIESVVNIDEADKYYDIHAKVVDNSE